MGSNGNPSVFTPAAVAAAPEDPLFGLMKAYREDPSDKKVDLGIGAYRDNNAKPWILPVVKKVCFDNLAHRLYHSYRLIYSAIGDKLGSFFFFPVD
jgi:aspartate aminotransferase